MKKFATVLFLVMIATTAFADIRYVVGQDSSKLPPEALGEKYFYIYGGYSLYFPNDFEFVRAGGSESSVVGGIGTRFSDNFRVELAYENIAGNYKLNSQEVDRSGNFGFANFIIDAKLPKEYRLFGQSGFVPFVGVGLGVGSFGEKLSRAYNFMGGISMQMNDRLDFVMTYKYIKPLAEDLEFDDGIVYKDFSGVSHNFGASLRFNF